MTKASVSLQDLRRKIYTKAKAEKSHRFWGLYVHVCKEETLREAYRLAKANDGAPGIDGVTFEQVEQNGLDEFLRQIERELRTDTYRPTRSRQVHIPKEGGKLRRLSIPTVKDRVVQGVLKLILEPIFEADFRGGSYGYRPRKTPHQAVNKVVVEILRYKTKVIDVDIARYFDNVRHHILLAKVARRVDDDKVMRLLKLILKAGGRRGVGQGSVISPLLANVYLSEVDEMLERAKETTRCGKYAQVEYVRFADDLVILIDRHPHNAWLIAAVKKRLIEELTKLDLALNADKSRLVDLTKDETFSFLGFDFRRTKNRSGKWGVRRTPRMKARTNLIRKLKSVFARFVSQPIQRVLEIINPILRGWVNYFRIGNSSRCFSFVKRWVEKKVRRHLMRAAKRPGFGWKRWSTDWLYQNLGLYSDYQIRYYQDPKALANR